MHMTKTPLTSTKCKKKALPTIEVCAKTGKKGGFLTIMTKKHPLNYMKSIQENFF